MKFCEGCFKPAYPNGKHDCPADRPPPPAPAKGLEVPPKDGEPPERVWLKMFWLPAEFTGSVGGWVFGKEDAISLVETFDHDLAAVPLERVEHLLRQARAEALEEAANILAGFGRDGTEEHKLLWKKAADAREGKDVR